MSVTIYVPLWICSQFWYLNSRYIHTWCFSSKSWGSGFSSTSYNFLRCSVLLIKVRKSCFLDVVKHKLLKNINVHSLNLLNFVCIVVFDVETAIQNAKLIILERLVLKIMSGLFIRFLNSVHSFGENFLFLLNLSFVIFMKLIYI